MALKDHSPDDKTTVAAKKKFRGKGLRRA